ncbi:MAG: V-type ATPase subunit [Myxococcales bacterium]|nr:V-type ATPase subunit [Deltaproteobacteria bacterium]NNK09686.1 V-type ATPase subunit [Myxococcales bacterium]NNL26015.1 V-type ATPase subunit [Myxococcales bacterium]
MAKYLGDLNARARGLHTHLLSPSELVRLAGATSLPALHRELSSLGFVASDSPATAASLESSIRRHTARQLRVLDRWCGDRRRLALSVLFEDEDRRSIQRILRGAEQGVSSEARMAGLVPTASLSERALFTLASQPTPADVVRMLLLWSHPFGPPLVEAASRAYPSLFELEIALQRAFARRASTRAREGGPQLVEYVEQVIDLMNAWSALLHFAERDPKLTELTFVEGGQWITRPVFDKLMGASTREDVEKELGWVLRKSALAPVFRDGVDEIAALESAALRAQIAWQHRSMRIDPSSAAPVIGFVIELRAQALSLRRIIWGVALRAPAALIQGDMVLA